MKKFRTVVIDDEEDIRKILAESIRESLNMELVGQADSVKTGIDLILDQKPEIVFLDIKLKGGDAFQLLNVLRLQMEHLPSIIFNTGYNDFELAQRTHNEYKDEVVMILKKPFWENWAEKEEEIIRKTIERIGKINVQNHYQSTVNETVNIRSESTTYVICLKDLILVEIDEKSKGRGKVLLYTKEKVFSIYNSLNKFEEVLSDDFLRVSRYAIINKNFIQSYNHSEQLLTLREITVKTINVGYNYREDLLVFLK